MSPVGHLLCLLQLTCVRCLLLLLQSYLICHLTLLTWFDCFDLLFDFWFDRSGAVKAALGSDDISAVLPAVSAAHAHNLSQGGED